MSVKKTDPSLEENSQTCDHPQYDFILDRRAEGESGGVDRGDKMGLLIPCLNGSSDRQNLV